MKAIKNEKAAKDYDVSLSDCETAIKIIFATKKSLKPDLDSWQFYCFARQIRDLPKIKESLDSPFVTKDEIEDAKQILSHLKTIRKRLENIKIKGNHTNRTIIRFFMQEKKFAKFLEQDLGNWSEWVLKEPNSTPKTIKLVDGEENALTLISLVIQTLINSFEKVAKSQRNPIVKSDAVRKTIKDSDFQFITRTLPSIYNGYFKEIHRMKWTLTSEGNNYTKFVSAVFELHKWEINMEAIVQRVKRENEDKKKKK